MPQTFTKRAVAVDFDGRSVDAWYWTSSLPKHALLDNVKRAAIGGDNETQFEQSFSSLAYSYIKDKAPKVLDYLVGFQLVDRNDDNTKAVGVFGAKVGPQWLLFPVFFLTGDLKGHQLCYMRKPGIFIPAQEKWVNHIISRKPDELGEGVRGTVYDRGALPPQLDGGLRLKSAGIAMQAWAIPYVAHAARNLTDKAVSHVKKASLDLNEFARDPKWLLRTATLARSYPLVKAGFDTFYGKDFFAKHAAEAKSRLASPGLFPPKRAAVTPKTAGVIRSLAEAADGGLHVIFRSDVETAGGGLSDVIRSKAAATSEAAERAAEEVKGRLLRDGFVVFDKRAAESITKTYSVEAPKSLRSPDAAGVYDIVEDSVEKSPMAVFPALVGPRVAQSVLVVRASDKSWLFTEGPEVLAMIEGPTPSRTEAAKTLSDWVGKLPATPTKGNTCVFVTPEGQCSQPFTVAELAEGGKTPSAIRFCTFAGAKRKNNFDGLVDVYSSDRQGSQMTYLDNTLVVPLGAKVLKLEEGPEWELRSGGPKPPRPATSSRVRDILFAKTAEISVVDAGGEMVVKSAKGILRGSPTDVVLHLLRTHGLDEGSARHAVKQASAGGYRFRVKYADPYTGLDNPATVPAVPAQMYDAWSTRHRSGRSVGEENYEIRVPGMSADMTNPLVYDPELEPDVSPDRGMAMLAQQAAQTGNKEFFDVAVIANDLKRVRPEDGQNKSLAAFMRALDELGWSILRFYWHQDDFVRRHGKESIPELEDSYLNSFDSLGDLCLFLKEHEGSGNLDYDYSSSGDLSSLAGKN